MIWKNAAQIPLIDNGIYNIIRPKQEMFTRHNHKKLKMFSVHISKP